MKWQDLQVVTREELRVMRLEKVVQTNPGILKWSMFYFDGDCAELGGVSPCKDEMSTLTWLDVSDIDIDWNGFQIALAEALEDVTL